MPPLRTVFLGTADLACCSLEALAQSPEVEVLGVVSQPDKAQGRKLKLIPTAVKVSAEKHSLPVWQPQRLRRDEELIDHLGTLDLDVIVVAAYGQILPDSVLTIPKVGCVNVHTSLLPKYRGAAPIQWAILNGDSETGVTLMKMDAGLDTGDIIAQTSTPIDPNETGGQLHDRLAKLGADFLLSQLPNYVAGNISTTPQDNSRASHARKLTKRDGEIDWPRPAREIRNQIRGLNPWPGTYAKLAHDDKHTLIKIWSATESNLPSNGNAPGTVIKVTSQAVTIACGQGSIDVLELQREGGKRLDASAFLAGFPIDPGTRFGEASTPS